MSKTLDDLLLEKIDKEIDDSMEKVASKEVTTPVVEISEDYEEFRKLASDLQAAASMPDKSVQEFKDIVKEVEKQ